MDYLSEFSKVLEKIKKQNVLIIGEIIFDEYNYVDPLGKPSKENILSVNFKNKETFFGGCLPVVKNLSNIYKNLTLLSLYNKKSNFDKVSKFLRQDRVKLNLIRKKTI